MYTEKIGLDRFATFDPSISRTRIHAQPPMDNDKVLAELHCLTTGDYDGFMAIRDGSATVGKCYDCRQPRKLREYERDSLAGTAVLHVEICEDCFAERTE